MTDRSIGGRGSLAGAGEPLDMPAAAMVTATYPSLRRNVAWSIAGHVIYAGTQWAMLVVLAKLTSPLAVGQFALSLAVTAPVVLLLNLNLRAAQATDARGSHEFGEYLALRLTTVPLMLVCVGAVAVAGYRRETAMVIIAMALAKCAESISDVIHGLFQRHERMELIAKSSIVKSGLSFAGFSTGVYLTGDVVWGVAGLAAAWTAVLVGYDIPQALHLANDPAKSLRLWPRYRPRSLLRLVRVTLPLGLAAMLIALNTNLPRYFVERFLGERELGVFAALAYFIVAGSTLIGAVVDTAMPRLATFHANANVPAYLRLLGKVLLIAAVVGSLGVLVALVGGRMLLQLMYGAEYAEAAGAFVWIMLAGLATYMAGVLSNGLIAARRFSEHLVLLIAVALVMAAACAVLVPKWGVMGAVLAVLCAAAMNGVGAGALIGQEFVNAARSARRPGCSLGGDKV